MENSVTLSEIIKSIETLDDNLVIYAVKNPTWEMNSRAMLIEVDEFAEDDPEVPCGMTYLLEINTAKEVLEVWRRWRDGKIPDETEKFNAIVYYAEKDAYSRD